ncbi:FIST N-terminal domain-containing protein [uncultured Acetatifactor sp.]|uniref:FIST N-terminal domain-containing protein n=1 Tax=uncultured Acetatifactor sp. TaxID=1671927 RepID=UPI00260B93B1|nr:FIST N-terminal domain-containing protein [uncultured Acetatifactor sp.]
MRQFFGMSNRGDLSEAVRNLDSPQFIMLLSNNAQFEEHVKALEKLYPGIPSIGCIGMSYDTKVVENGVGIIAFSGGVSATANVLEQVSVMPVKYIDRLEADIRKINGSKQDTVCIDFCSGNDACVLTTLYTSLRSRGIQLMGGTGDGGKVSANGKVYEDSVAYALVRNQNGRVKTYKENIYHQMGNYRFIASNTDRANYIIGSLNGNPAKQVYQSILHVTDQEILTQTFKNPFGKLNGDDTCIVSIKEVNGNSLACFRQVNDSDVLVLLELGDYRAIVDKTIADICRDFPKRSAVFSVNCLFRYKLFTEQRYMATYLQEMAKLGSHAGLVGYGEHYNSQFVNQSMTCVVFE